MKPLTKSQFKLGLHCIQKLRHYRAGLPSAFAENDLMRLLSEGGAAVEALQRAIEPPDWLGAAGGASVVEASCQQIRLAAAQPKPGGSRLSEVTLAHGDFLARIDLLRVFPDRIELVEIKSKSWKGSVSSGRLEGIVLKNGREVCAAWVPYLQDLAFQHELLLRWLTQHAAEIGLPSEIPVVPKLILVNAEGVATAADCLGNFRTRYEEFRGGFRARVDYDGAGVHCTELLLEVDASEPVRLMAANVQAKEKKFAGLGVVECMERMATMVRAGHWPDAMESLGRRCKQCEYRVAGPAGSGLRRCWGGGVDAIPYHILKLARLSDAQVLDAIGSGAPRDAKITHLREDQLNPSQKPQWRCANSGAREVHPEFLRDRMTRLKAPDDGPLYFLDFETARYPVPYRAGGRANELIPFQFEGHFLPGRDAALTDRVRLEGFLDLESLDPRRAFVRALSDQFGSHGPIYHWSHFERDVLEKIARSLEADPAPEPGDNGLVWECERLKDRLVDLCEIASLNLTVPETHGSYSIKRFLPVIWTDATLRNAFAPGQAPGDSNHYAHPEDPYQSLPGLPRDFLERLGPEAVASLAGEGGESDAITNGGLAMVYYHYVRLFGGHDQPEIHAQFRQYCQLDSAAMVMAYDYMRRVR
jgi:hypothetical protein